MSKQISKSNSTCSSDQEDSELRRGPWTLEEDTLLVHYISRHGEGRWNLLAKRAGLRRSGKSCRLRWLNYLKPDIKRGNFTTQEQLLILELHSKWGNRWSKIAQHLPGRTDNEIKNYWRTRVQKQARHLNVDANSAAFQDVIRLLWIPRLIQKMEGSSSLPNNNNFSPQTHQDFASRNPSSSSSLQQLEAAGISNDFMPRLATQETNGSSSANYSATVDVSHMCQQTNLFPPGNLAIDVRTCYDVDTANLAPMSATGDFFAPVADCCVYESDWVNQDMCDSLWINNNAEEIWGLNRQF